MNTSLSSIKMCAIHPFLCSVVVLGFMSVGGRGSRVSSASVSSRGFEVVRGRGYRPLQVIAYVEALSDDRDAAWERAARLTVLAREMEEELERLRVRVAGLPEQTYESLGDGPRRLFLLALEEATAVRESARQHARDLVDLARDDAAEVEEAARAYAATLRAVADEYARERLAAAREKADEIRIEARLDVKERRTEALAEVRRMRERTSELLAEEARAQARRLDEIAQEEAARAAELDARQAEAEDRAEKVLAEARQAFADAGEAARRCADEARERAAEVLAEAQARVEGVERETERVLRDHADLREDVQTQMDHVCASLSALTGRAVE